MKMICKLNGLDCANCAAKMERSIGKISGVEKASVKFMTQKLTLEIADGAAVENILREVEKCIKKVEPDCEIMLK